jgi:hypothetical protein
MRSFDKSSAKAFSLLGTHSTDRVIPFTHETKPKEVSSEFVDCQLIATSIDDAKKILGINLHYHKLAYA